MKKLLLIALVGCVYGTIINVPEDYNTIQEGINAAVEGDTVLVAQGVYYENIVWAATNRIKLIGSGEDDCFIDGNQQASVIRFEDALGGIIDTNTLITGFTIQDGSAGQGGVCISENPALP